jgi:hypothetical protein
VPRAPCFSGVLNIHSVRDGIRDGSEFQPEVHSRDTGSNSCAKLTCAFRFVAGAARRLQGGVRGSIPLVSTTLTSGNVRKEIRKWINGIQLPPADV